MVEYSDVFDEVDEFQKKAKVTINRNWRRTLVHPSDACAKPADSPKFVLMSFCIVRRRNSKNVHERRHD